jgi:oxalate decarboxylase
VRWNAFSTNSTYWNSNTQLQANMQEGTVADDLSREATGSRVTTRRRFLEVSGVALAAVAAVPLTGAQEIVRTADHHQPNEQQPGPNNTALDAENPSSVWSPETDNGTVEPFKYSFGLAHKRIETGGWTRQVTARELPISKTMAGVEMRLISGGVRELHWHTSAEWAFMIYGSARISAVDADGRSFVNDVAEGDLWLFPGGVPHSIQGLGPRWMQVPAGLQRR